MLLPLRGAARLREGFTLIEVVIASALVAAGLVGVLAVIVQFNDRATTELGLTEVSQQVATLDAQMARDVEAARPCAANRIGTIFTQVTQTSIGWTIDPDGDGAVDQVTWEIIGGQVRRAVSPDVGGCQFGATAPSVMMEGVAGVANDPGGPLLYVTGRGQTDPAFDNDGGTPAPPYPGGCTIATCTNLHTLVFDVDVVARDGTVYPVTRRYEFPEHRSRLR